MSWMRVWGCVKKQSRCSKPPCYTMKDRDQNGILYVDKTVSSMHHPGGHPLVIKTSWRAKMPYLSAGTFLGCKSTSPRYVHSVQNDPNLSRDFFVRLWIADRKKSRYSGKQNPRVIISSGSSETFGVDRTISGLLERFYPGASAVKAKSYNKKSGLRQPPTSQSVTGILEPMSLEESKVAPLLARSNLLITRDIEWANLVLGFEQENRYAIVDVCYPQAPVGFIREQSNVIARQYFIAYIVASEKHFHLYWAETLLRLRRPFIAHITDGLGNELFRVRRPFWWITSSIYAEINGKEIGVVHRRWHLWRRIYDLYLGDKQFAVVENPGLWNWTFTLKDIDGKVLAEVDRDWRGFGFEIFTDAGQYVIRFGSADSGVEPAPGVQELKVNRSLTLSERAVAVALAVSLDNDYFSRHGGWGFPFMVVDD